MLLLLEDRQQVEDVQGVADGHDDAVDQQQGHGGGAAGHAVQAGLELAAAGAQQQGTMTDQMEAARPAQPMAGRKPSGQMMPPIMGGTKVMSMVLVRPRRLLSKPHRSAM